MGPIRFFSSRRRRPAAAALALVIGGFSPWTTAARGGPAPSPCASGKPVLTLRTREGTIAIELLPRAAPRAVARLAELARGPLFNPALLPDGEDAEAPGFFDGLRFDYTHPQVEIVTESRAPERLFELAAEIDAESLGLHEKKIASAGEAMDIFQQELTVQFRERGKDPAAVTPILREWLTRFSESYDPGFLVGVSRKEVNQALGYVYESGLESRPAMAGAVLLKATAPGRAGMRLAILLADQPRRTGREMVVGRVTGGLDLARGISVRPLLVPPELRDRRYRPADPVVIERARVGCE